MPGDPSKQATLTVLGGPMAGAKLALEESVDNVLVGSDPSCRFCLPLPGVSPIHARIWIDAAGITVYDTNSPRGLFINDDRVVNQSPLRNGDVLWLGTPGDDDVVMIQCRFAAQDEAPVGMPVIPDGAVDDSATVMMGAAAPAEPLAVAPDAASEPTVFDMTAGMPPGQDLFVEVSPESAAPMPPPADPLSFETTLPPRASLAEFEDETIADQPALVPPEPPPFMAPAEATVLVAPPVEVAPPPFADYDPPPPPVEAAPPIPPPPTPVPPARPKVDARTSPPRPSASATRPPSASRPPSATRPPSAPSPRPRTPVARPSPPPAARGKKGGSGARVAIIGIVLAALGGGGYFAWRQFGQAGPSPEASPSSAPGVVPTPRAASTPAVDPTPGALDPTPVAVAPTPEASPEPQEVVTIVKPKSPSPSATAVAAASPSPSPSPRKPTPSPVASTAAAPSAEALRAQQVASLVGQAEAAVAGQRYDAAAGLFDEVLKLDPQNARAQTGKSSATAIAASLKRRFVPGRTVVTGKSSKADLGGFDTSDVKVTKAPDYSGRIDFEVSPSAVKPGDGYTVKVSLTNDGKKGFKVGGITATTSLNGAPSGGAVTPKVRELEPQQKAVVHEITGTWPEDVKNWTLQVVVTSDRGDTFRNQVTWR